MLICKQPSTLGLHGIIFHSLSSLAFFGTCVHARVPTAWRCRVCGVPCGV